MFPETIVPRILISPLGIIIMSCQQSGSGSMLRVVQFYQECRIYLVPVLECHYTNLHVCTCVVLFFDVV